MRAPLLKIFLSLALLAVMPAAPAAEKAAKGGSKTASGGYLYRYRNAQGVLVMESSIPPEYATKGYQVLNRMGQVLEDVPAVAEVSDEQRRASMQNEAQTSRRDGELRKLYSAPQDAERLRDRQLDALTLKVEHAKGQLNQTMGRRKTEVEQAARLERSGTAVPAHTRDMIGKLTQQTIDQEKEIKVLESEQKRIREEFEPVIARLRVIYPDKAGVAPAAAPAVTAPVAPAQKVLPQAVAAPVKIVAPVAAPASAPVRVVPPAQQPVARVPQTPPPAAAAQPVVAPVVAKPVPPPPPPVAAPVKVAPPAKTVPPVSSVPPVKPVAVTPPKPKSPGTPAPTESEKAAAKAKAKEEFGLDEEPRSAGGLRPTGVR